MRLKSTVQSALLLHNTWKLISTHELLIGRIN
jgi:hypothetical protein